jgi:hypothetical protein
VLALALIVLAAPLSRSAAQTCEGSASFQDGRMRAGAFYQGNHDGYDGGSQLAFGIPRSFYATLTLNARGEFPVPSPPGDHLGGAAWPELGGGIELGYQIHLGDTPFQFCPAVMWHGSSNPNSYQVSERGFGGNLGYRLPVSNRLTLVPAAGVWWVTSTRCCIYSRAYNDMSMTMGLVFHETLTIQPGLAVSSLSGSKTIYTIAVSTHWWK